MWDLREAIGEVGREYGSFLSFDVGIATSRLGEFVETCDACLGGLIPAKTLYLGHIADGNLHVIVPVETNDEAAATEIETRVYELISKMQGTVSAEHGIGLLKRPWLHKTRSLAEIEIMRRIKSVLDPANILNPGKVIQP